MSCGQVSGPRCASEDHLAVKSTMLSQAAWSTSRSFCMKRQARTSATQKHGGHQSIQRSQNCLMFHTLSEGLGFRVYRPLNLKLGKDFCWVARQHGCCGPRGQDGLRGFHCMERPLKQLQQWRRCCCCSCCCCCCCCCSCYCSCSCPCCCCCCCCCSCHCRCRCCFVFVVVAVIVVAAAAAAVWRSWFAPRVCAWCV